MKLFCKVLGHVQARTFVVLRLNEVAFLIRSVILCIDLVFDMHYTRLERLLLYIKLE